MLIYFLEAGCVCGAQNDVGAFPIFIVSQGFFCFAAKQKKSCCSEFFFYTKMTLTNMSDTFLYGYKTQKMSLGETFCAAGFVLSSVEQMDRRTGGSSSTFCYSSTAGLFLTGNIPAVELSR